MATRSSGLAGLVALALAACAANSGPRFTPEIAASFARQPMRHLETDLIDLYYPESAHGEALRIAARLTHCLETLHTFPVSKTPRPKLLLYLTSANFNNAFVQPMDLGSPQQMVIPLHETDELFNLTIDPGGEVADISCHEAVHYVQLQQVEGLWYWINRVGGEILSPNIFTESWFLEGLAVHYEGRLGKEVGRPWNPIWHGLFLSGVAAESGHLNAGYLQSANRDATPFGGNYLVGEPFVDYLAATYGEEKLWDLVDLEANSPAPQLAVALQFRRVYGKTSGALFDEFTDKLKADAAKRPRPPDQRVLLDGLGYYARLAAANDGTLAVILGPRNRPVELVFLAPDNHEIFREPLGPILPERPFIATSPESVSGMTFSADGKRLYFVMQDLGIDGDNESKLIELDVQSGRALRTWGHLEGMGGGLTADGAHYVFTHLENDIANLVELDLASGYRRQLTNFTSHQSLGTAAISPSGKRIAFPVWQGEGFDIHLLEGGQTRAVTHDERFNQSPRWIDEDHLVLLRDVDGRAQAEILDVNTGAIAQATDAPFVAFDPSPRPGGKLAFVNRDGWSWTLDEVPLDLMRPGEVPGLVTPPPQADAESPVHIIRDDTYHPFDHLLVPTYHLPSLLFDTSNPNSVGLGFEVAGSDRLGWHNYDLVAAFSVPDHASTFAANYINMQLAPWQLGIGVGRTEDAAHTTDKTIDVGASRTFWDTPVSFDVPITRRDSPTIAAWLVGPRAAVLLSPTDGSPYGGIQRGFSLSLAAQVFPKALGNDFEFVDLRAALRVWLPQPIPRGSLSVLGLVRGLPGAPTGLLQVGGLEPTGVLFQNTLSSGDGLPLLALPTGLEFTEPLRGYEDFALHGNTLQVAGADYHYPVVIDYGWASFLYVLPSFFVQQVDLEGFARFAQLQGDGTSQHRVIGASVSLAMQLGSFPAPQLFYQFAQRFDDGLGSMQLVGLSF